MFNILKSRIQKSDFINYSLLINIMIYSYSFKLPSCNEII